MALARDVDPRLSPDGDRQLLLVTGELNGRVGIPGSETSIAYITEIGPVYVGIPTDQTELLGIHLRLLRALVDGVAFAPGYASAIRKGTFGQVKRSFARPEP